jgi:hypothetical protein
MPENLAPALIRLTRFSRFSLGGKNEFSVQKKTTARRPWFLNTLQSSDGLS